MSRPYDYYSDQWPMVTSGRGDNASRGSEQRLPRRIMASSDGRGQAPSDHDLMQTGDYGRIPGGSGPTPTRDRMSSVSRARQSMTQYQHPGRDDIAYPMELNQRCPDQPAVGTMYEMRSLDRDDRHLPRTPSSFQSPYQSPPIGPDHRIQRRPWEDAERALDPNKHGNPYLLKPSDNMHFWSIEGAPRQDLVGIGDKLLSKRDTANMAGSAEEERRSKRYRGGRDEFDGSVQYLSKPLRSIAEPREVDLPSLPVHLGSPEQQEILDQVNNRLSQCAFDFVALYRFPIPMEPNKPPVQRPKDKGWTEWAYLLKRLATKRRIPAHTVYQGQIKELTTVLDNSLEMRHATKPQPRPLKDDRTILQFISAGIQVGKILKDGATMEYLDKLYQQTEKVIRERGEAPPNPR